MAMQHVRPGEIYDLASSSSNPGNGFTVAIVKTKMFEAVRLVVRSGTSIKEHRFDGPITLHCLEGRVMLGLSEYSRELSDGQWLYLDGGTSHSISGVQDATLLLTILFPHQDRTVAGQVTRSQNGDPTTTAP
jgi:quercetin dioxygenase-like cupin family protein